MKAVTAVTGTPPAADPLVNMGKNMFDDKAAGSKRKTVSCQRVAQPTLGRGDGREASSAGRQALSGFEMITG